MHTARLILSCAILLNLPACAHVAVAQDPKQLVNQAVQTELVADRNDHSRWVYYDVDRRPSDTTQQWVAETGDGDVHRILIQKNHPLSFAAQRNSMDQFVHDPDAQARQRKSGQHDDRQSEEMLRLLPNAFLWNIAGTQGHTILLRFAPNPQFKPPTWEARVFAAMEGTMRIDQTQHRIVSLQGRLVRNVHFCGGLCGSLAAGGTFDVERREIGPSIWQIVETHVHIHGTALFFKNISQDEDDQKTRFQLLPGDISLQQAETKLLQENG
jgi:hypothetical protein